MGSNQCCYSEEEIEEMERTTMLTKKQIMRAYWRFNGLCPDMFKHKQGVVMPFRIFKEINQLRGNPFAERLFMIFANKRSGIKFKEYLMMLSSFHKYTPMCLKLATMFQIFDIDEDGFLNEDDVKAVAGILLGQHKEKVVGERMDFVIEGVMHELDIVKHRRVAPVVFNHRFKTRYEEFWNQRYTMKM